MDQMWKLGVPVKDSATQREGMLTHLHVEMGDVVNYSFQPRGLNEETGEPLKCVWLTAPRVLGGELVPVPPAMQEAIDALGSQAEDMASGFSGMVTAAVLHINGCCHIGIQPKTTQKNGTLTPLVDFDIRRCKGKKIVPLTEKELEKSKAERPSPAEMPARR